MARLLVEVGEGRHTGTDTTFGELLERWYEMKVLDWSPKTAVEHRRFIDKKIAPKLAKVSLRKLGAEDLDRFYAGLRKSGGMNGRPLGPASVRRIHVVVHAALEQAVKWRWVAYNPANAASPPAPKKSDIRPPTPAEVAKLIALATEDEPEFGLYLRLAAITGARRSELCAATWSDLDVERRRLTIRRAVVEGADGIVVKDTKTHLVHPVALDETTVEMLLAHRLRMAERALAVGTKLADDSFVFSYDPACEIPWRPDGITHRFGKLRKRAGLPKARAHDLRHWVGTQLGDAGLPIATISGRLGHSRSSTTLDMYTKSIDTTDERAAAVLADLLDRQPS